MTTPEWRTIPGFDPRYEVSDGGHVRSWAAARGGWAVRPRVLVGAIHGHGYPTYRIPREDGTYTTPHAHELVGRAFFGPLTEGMVTRHLNGNPLDNRVENLAYGTPLENISDKRVHGTMAAGSGHGRSKINEQQAMEIVARYKKGGESQLSIAKHYGLAQSTVSSIIRGVTWNHCTGVIR